MKESTQVDTVLFSMEVKAVLDFAREEVIKRGSARVELFHLHSGLLRGIDVATCKATQKVCLSIDRQHTKNISHALTQIGTSEFRHSPKMIPFSKDAREAIDRAAELCRQHGESVMTADHLLDALLSSAVVNRYTGS